MAPLPPQLRRGLRQAGRVARASVAFGSLLLVQGCMPVLLSPAGAVARQERDVLLASTGLMLLIILPVMALTALFAWRYRGSNPQAGYDPEFNHSTALEVGIWAAPLAIIIALGALTWVSTHTLDPYRPVQQVGLGRPIVGAQAKPLRVQVTALDWKWLFIYPDLGVATVNELAVPLGQPLDFQITSSHMMNTFLVPAMAGAIYAMPGMVTPMHAVMDRLGTYTGFSGNYTGTGFSEMHFPMKVLSAVAFDRWVERVRAGGGSLDGPGYLRLEKPTVAEPVHEFAAVTPGLFERIANECVDPHEMCVASMMNMDDHGGAAPEKARSLMRMNEHGGEGGLVGPASPFAPPSRHLPHAPGSGEPNAARPAPQGGTASG